MNKTNARNPQINLKQNLKFEPSYQKQNKKKKKKKQSLDQFSKFVSKIIYRQHQATLSIAKQLIKKAKNAFPIIDSKKFWTKLKTIKLPFGLIDSLVRFMIILFLFLFIHGGH